jgi:hypothetical protein
MTRLCERDAKVIDVHLRSCGRGVFRCIAPHSFGRVIACVNASAIMKTISEEAADTGWFLGALFATEDCANNCSPHADRDCVFRFIVN